MKRVANLIFWMIILSAIIYIFVWPSDTLQAKMLKGFFALLLFGGAYANQIQEQLRDVTDRLKTLETRNSEINMRVSENSEECKTRFERLKSDVEQLKYELEAVQLSKERP